MTSIVPLSSSKDDQRIKVLFESIVNLVRTSPPSQEVYDENSGTNDETHANTSVLPDSVKLKLYGYYKVATEESSPTQSCPSIFNVVARAKYNAWIKAADECSSASQAMESYVSLAEAWSNKAGFQTEVETLKMESQKEVPPSSSQPQLSSTKTTTKILTTNVENTSERIPTPPKHKRHKYPFLPHPVIARGTLDISFSDLFFASYQCTRSNSLHKMNHYASYIEKQWIEHYTPHSYIDKNNDYQSPSVVVGLSVRSLLDLYLTIKSYPTNSEIIVVPPLNIKGMMDIMIQTHNIKVVPVDLPHSNTLGVNVKHIEKAISKHTVAIMVVHPFGKMTMSTSQMKALSETVCQKYNLDLLEDCAECFMGQPSSQKEKESLQLPMYTNEYATVSFYSFGMIKTATALGGGIAYFPPNSQSKNQHVIKRMKQLLHVRQLSQSQPNREFLWKVLKAFVLKFVADQPYLVGFMALICQLLGKNYGEFITSWIKAFPDDQTQSSSNQHIQRMKQLRRTPSTALYALLSRRLQHYKQTHTENRMKKCQKVIELLKKRNMIQSGRVGIPKDPINQEQIHPVNPHLFWLFPILVKDPDKVCDIMMKYGFDVPRGTSQLACIEQFLPKDDNIPNPCPYAKEMMKSVLYLPIASKWDMSQRDVDQMIDALDWATWEEKTTIEKPDVKGAAVGTHKQNSLQIWWAMGSLFIFTFYLIVKPSFLIRLFTIALIAIPRLFLSGIIFLISAIYLRFKLSPTYLSSTFFARYNSILARSKTVFEKNKESLGKEDIKTSDSMRTSKDEVENNTDIFKSLDVLRIPFVQPPTDSTMPPSMAFVTGSTGFIGTLLVRSLLLNRKTLNIPGGVVLLCRPKFKRSAKERIYNHIMKDPIFSFLSESDFEELIHVIEGEVTSPNLGMNQETLKYLTTLNVTHVFHVAASVSFVQPLDDAAESIITSSLQMQTLAKTGFLSPAKYIHFSTAFVHGNCADAIVTEELFDFGAEGIYDVSKIYESMMGTQSLAWNAMYHFKFPNTYTFAKSVCEHLISKRANGDPNTIIVRPSIVGPSISMPYEGWSGRKPSTLVAAGCLYLKFQWSLWCFGKTKVAVVPVDVVVQFTIHKAFAGNEKITLSSSSSSLKDVDGSNSEDVCTRSDSSDDDVLVVNSITKPDVFEHDVIREKKHKCIYNVTWNLNSPDSHTFQWRDFASGITQTGRVRGYYGSFTAYVTLFIAQNLRLSKGKHGYLHQLLVKRPLAILIWVVRMLGLEGFSKKLRQMSPFLDLPLLFYHFNNHNFRFESELLAPNEFNGERYMMNCILAAEDFMSKFRKRSNTSQKDSTLNIQTSSPIATIAGKRHSPVNSDIWWIMTQPQGNVFIRITGFVLIKILRYTTTELTVDLDSFSRLSESLQKKDLQDESEFRPHIVLAPTHRSLFDFLVLSFVCFSIPEMGISIPNIAAADDFKRIPFLGWFAKGAQAFFLRRGAGKEDPQLKQQIMELKAKGGKDGTVFEVFLEGKRSRDRRFIDAKTGMLRCLANTGGEHLLLPISISYERIPDQSTLVGESDGGRRISLDNGGLIKWLWKVYKGEINVGRIHIQASQPVPLLRNEKNVKQIAKMVQDRQKEDMVVSDYHVDAGARILQLSSNKIRKALETVRCKFWHPNEDEHAHTYSLRLPDSKSELWSIMLQYGHWFSPYLSESHPKWSLWLSGNSKESDLATKVYHRNVEDDSVNAVVTAMIKEFEAAETTVRDSIALLKSKGFSSPTRSHLIQCAKENNNHISTILISAAVTWLLVDIKSQTCNSYEDRKMPVSEEYIFGAISESKITPLFRNSGKRASVTGSTNNEIESFGAWGYKDSGFIFQIDENGGKTVIMKGNRYDFSGRKMPRVVRFLETEMNVTVDPRKTSLSTVNGLNEIPVSTCDIDDNGLNQLRNLLDNDKKSVSTSSIDRVRHGTGHTQEDMYKIRTKSLQHFRVPDVVVWPRNEKEVGELVDLASKEQWCLIPYGGGTNVTHATWCPTKEDEPRPIISVDMKLMKEILWINEEDGIAHVQAGITGSRLVREMEKVGLTIGHEPDSIEFSTLGGWVATKASGMKQNKYGNIEDIVLNVRVAGANGLMWQHHDNTSECADVGHAFERVSTGMDLKSLMLGSEGCLGIITSVVIKVWPIAERKEYESVILSNFECGIDFARNVASLRALKPASVRLVDNEQFKMAQALAEESSGVTNIQKKIMKLAGSIFTNFAADSVVAVTITFEGNNDEIKLQKALIKKLTQKHGGLLAGPKIGKSGYDLTFAIAYLRDFAMTYFFLAESFEAFVPWSKISNLIKKTKERIRYEFQQRLLPGRPMISARVTQLYDNGACVYFYFCMNFENVPNPSDVYGKIEHCAREEILKQGGSLSHHHGIGKLRAPFMNNVNSKFLQSTLLNMKKSIDPNNIFGAQNGCFVRGRD